MPLMGAFNPPLAMEKTVLAFDRLSTYLQGDPEAIPYLKALGETAVGEFTAMEKAAFDRGEAHGKWLTQSARVSYEDHGRLQAELVDVKMRLELLRAQYESVCRQYTVLNAKNLEPLTDTDLYESQCP